jgi:enoyl-CoA hydratase
LPALLAEYTGAGENAPLTIDGGQAITARDPQAFARYRSGPVHRSDPRLLREQDYTEGRTAFMEKRKPVFKGK